jgi:hypothetical protein
MATSATKTLITLAVAAMAAMVVPTVVAVNSGGGTVSNSAPTVLTFSNAAGAAQSKDTSDIFSGSVRDKNGEARIAQISVTFTSAPGGVSPTLFDHTVSSGDRAATSEPGSFGGDGFKVWNTGGADGVLAFKFQYTWTVNGAYTARALVDDQSNLDQFGPAADISITISDGFTLSAHPVTAAGADAGAVSWGTWTAIPGASAVDSLNYIEIHNTGNNPTQAVTLDFTPSVWTGADSTTTFNLNSNIKFACAESPSTSAVAPNTLVYTLGSSSASGSITANFSAMGRYLYCTYEVVAIPDPLLDQDYNAAFTAS